MSKQNLLILGGTTFVSQELAKFFISQRYNVDILTRGRNKIQYLGINNHFIADRLNYFEMESSLSGQSYEYIIDTSTYSEIEASILIKIINRKNLKKYIFCSTGAVYSFSNKVLTESSKKGENKNWGNYGINKRKAEVTFLNEFKKNKFPVTIFRPSYICGEENNLYRESFFFGIALTNKKLAIPNNGKTQIQFIYINDLIQSFESVLNNISANGESFNLSNPEILTWNKLLDIIGLICNVEFDKIYINKNLKSRDFFPFRDLKYLMDVSKLSRYEIHVPNTSILEGLKLTYKWYINNRDKIIRTEFPLLKQLIK